VYCHGKYSVLGQWPNAEHGIGVIGIVCSWLWSGGCGDYSRWLLHLLETIVSGASSAWAWPASGSVLPFFAWGCIMAAHFQRLGSNIDHWGFWEHNNAARCFGSIHPQKCSRNPFSMQCGCCDLLEKLLVSSKLDIMSLST